MWTEQGNYLPDALLVSLTNSAMDGVDKQALTIESAGPTVDSHGDRCIVITYRLHCNNKCYGTGLVVADYLSQDSVHSKICEIATVINTSSHPSTLMSSGEH